MRQGPRAQVRPWWTPGLKFRKADSIVQHRVPRQGTTEPLTPHANAEVKTGRSLNQYTAERSLETDIVLLELFPIRCTHLIDKEMQRNNEIERIPITSDRDSL